MQILSRQRGLGTQRGYGYTEAPTSRYTLRDLVQMEQPAPQEAIAEETVPEPEGALRMIRDPEQRVNTSALQNLPSDPRFSNALASAGKSGLLNLGAGALQRGVMGADSLVSPGMLASAGTNMIGNLADNMLNLSWQDPKTVDDGRWSSFKNPMTRTLGMAGSAGANKFAPGSGPIGSMVGKAVGDLVDDAGDWRSYERVKDFLEDTEGYTTARGRFNQAADLIDEPSIGGRKHYRDPYEWAARQPKYDQMVADQNGQSMARTEEQEPAMPTDEEGNVLGYGNQYKKKQQEAMSRASGAERGDNAYESGVDRAERMMRESRQIGTPGITDWSDPVGSFASGFGNTGSGGGRGLGNTMF